MTDDFVRRRLDAEIEQISLNQLNELGNQAISLGLIIGHGHHRGQYEILRQGEVLLMSPQEAISYLQNLIRSVTEES
ncbi:MAG: hypothetical protein QNJ46_22845 [Leptolyngbyaceae cyanobacterium MO_188.B28]|nr:hypothetical protein [Leptolyngbyaceae cyanobacterium MO_188.B28]